MNDFKVKIKYGGKNLNYQNLPYRPVNETKGNGMKIILMTLNVITAIIGAYYLLNIYSGIAAIITVASFSILNGVSWAIVENKLRGLI